MEPPPPPALLTLQGQGTVNPTLPSSTHLASQPPQWGWMTGGSRQWFVVKIGARPEWQVRVTLSGPQEVLGLGVSSRPPQAAALALCPSKGKACEWPLLSGSPLPLPPSAAPAPASPSGLRPLTLGIHAQVPIPCPPTSLPGGGGWQMPPTWRLPQEAGSQSPSSPLALLGRAPSPWAQLRCPAWSPPAFGLAGPAGHPLPWNLGWTCLERLVPPNGAVVLGLRPRACPDVHRPQILPPPPESTRGVFSPGFYSALLGLCRSDPGSSQAAPRLTV